MRGLTQQERRALIVDVSAEGERIPDRVFDGLVRRGLGRWVRDCWWRPWRKTFYATPAGELALQVCPERGH